MLKSLLLKIKIALKLLKAVQSFYKASRACDRVGNEVSAGFPVNVGDRAV